MLEFALLSAVSTNSYFDYDCLMENCELSKINTSFKRAVHFVDRDRRVINWLYDAII